MFIFHLIKFKFKNNSELQLSYSNLTMNHRLLYISKITDNTVKPTPVTENHLTKYYNYFMNISFNIPRQNYYSHYSKLMLY